MKKNCQHIIWTQFKNFLLNELKLTALQTFDIIHKWKFAQQIKNQSVSCFIAFMNKLKEQMQSFTDE